MEASLPWILAVVCAMAALGSALYVRAAGPVVATAELRQLRAEVQATREDWAATKVALENLSDEIARDYERVRTARNRLSAAEAKARRDAETEEHQVDPMQHAMHRWAQQGLL